MATMRGIQFITTREAAKMLGIQEESVLLAARTGRLRSVIVGHRRLYDINEVKAYYAVRDVQKFSHRTRGRVLLKHMGTDYAALPACFRDTEPGEHNALGQFAILERDFDLYVRYVTCRQPDERGKVTASAPLVAMPPTYESLGDEILVSRQRIEQIIRDVAQKLTEYVVEQDMLSHVEKKMLAVAKRTPRVAGRKHPQRTSSGALLNAQPFDHAVAAALEDVYGPPPIAIEDDAWRTRGELKNTRSPGGTIPTEG